MTIIDEQAMTEARALEIELDPVLEFFLTDAEAEAQQEVADADEEYGTFDPRGELYAIQ